MRETLAQNGYALLSATDGQQGLDLLAREPVDLVITDFDLPGLDGVEFLRQLRRGYPNQRCIMLTPHGVPEAVIGALREHICDLLPKPFSPTDLREAVETTLTQCPIARVEVVSASPDWVELLVPCDLGAVAPLQKALAELEAGRPTSDPGGDRSHLPRNAQQCHRTRRQARSPKVRGGLLHQAPARGRLPDQGSGRRL